MVNSNNLKNKIKNRFTRNDNGSIVSEFDEIDLNDGKNDGVLNNKKKSSSSNLYLQKQNWQSSSLNTSGVGTSTSSLVNGNSCSKSSKSLNSEDKNHLEDEHHINKEKQPVVDMMLDRIQENIEELDAKEYTNEVKFIVSLYINNINIII